MNVEHYAKVPCPKTRFEKRVLLVGGVLNIIVPCGLGSLIAGCWLRDNQLISTGVLQLVLTIFFVGVLWSMMYGGLMLLSAFTVTIASPSSRPPPTTTVAPSVQVPSGSLGYQCCDPQESCHYHHTYTILSPAKVTEKSRVLTPKELKALSPAADLSATWPSGAPADEVFTKEEEYSAKATLVTQPQGGALLYQETVCA